MKRSKRVDPEANLPLDRAKRRTLRKLAASGLFAVGGQLSLSGMTAWGDAHPRPGAGSMAKLRAACADANVVVCVVDAARADHFGCNGYRRQTTPNADRMAGEALVFDNHFCQDTRTAASTASLFTGQYPDTHLAYKHRPVAESVLTMARVFGEAGFRTALFSSNVWASPMANKGLHFRDAYDPDDAVAVTEGREGWYSPEPLLRLLERWLQEQKGARFLCYVHFIPPHIPYVPPHDMRRLFRHKQPPGYQKEKYRPGEWAFPLGREPAYRPLPLPQWINQYDANLRYGDWAVGEVERLLREGGIYEKTLLIVTADHGEAFGEHGFVFHDGSPYDEVAHIPLLVRFPHGDRIGRVNALTQSIDVLPTLCDLFRIKQPKKGVQGKSLLPLMAGSKEKVHDYVFTHSHHDRHKYMVRGLDYALVLYGQNQWRALYDLRSDPEQVRNIIGNDPKKAEELVAAFRAFAQDQRWDVMYFIDPTAEYAERPRGIPEKAVPPGTERQLKALGYLK